MKLGLYNFLLCFVVSIIIAPAIIKALRKFKFGQSILVYVEQHKLKSGTPTMGGIIIILSSLIGYIIFLKDNNILSTISILSLLFFGILGFLDDFIKIKFKQNEGLKPYQKIIGQLGLSIIITIFICMSSLVGTKFVIPFLDLEINIGYWIIPLIIIFYLAVVNSVNLIDGLDGLSAGVSSIVLGVFTIILLIMSKNYESVYLAEINNIIVITLGVIGSILGLLCFNSFPAKVFMGDTGSLALGGYIASIFALTKQYLLILILGIMFVITTLSVIIQVVYFRFTKKRIFKMTPIHHHFESSTHEAKVTFIYIVITLIIGIVSIVLYL